MIPATPHPDGVTAAAARTIRITPRRAFTLLELVIVLVIAGIGLALVAPTLRPPAPGDPTAAPVVALRARAARLGLSIDTIVGGRRLQIAPTGVCIAVSAPAPGTAWDPARCSLVRAAP